MEQAEADPGFAEVNSYTRAAIEANRDHASLRLPLADEAAKLLRTYEIKFENLLLNPMRDYLAQLQTKLKLHQQLTSGEFKTFWENFLLSHNRYMFDLSFFISKVGYLK